MCKKAYLDEEKLKKYLDGGICREERQYAAMLFYIFMSEKGKKNGTQNDIIKSCLKLHDSTTPVIIEEVYFEATLMRDFFEADRSKFNKQLLEYCLGWLYPEKDGKNSEFEEIRKKWEEAFSIKNSSRNLGQSKSKKKIQERCNLDSEIVRDRINQNKISDESEEFKKFVKQIKEKACLDIAGMMMNATPDILVVYRVGTSKSEKRYVKALECKYLSGEGDYEDVAGVGCKMQFFIQECIMHFCFGNTEKVDDKGDRYVRFPSFHPSPNKGFWGENQRTLDLWRETCDRVYHGILNQDLKSQDFFNEGVEVIQFERPDKKKPIKDSVLIPIDNLKTYFNENHLLDDVRRDAIEKLRLADDKDIQLLIDSAIHIHFLHQLARKEGLLIFDFAAFDLLPEYLRHPFLLIADALEPKDIIKITTNEYWISAPKGVHAMITYFYILGALYIQAGENPDYLQKILSSLIPSKWRMEHQKRLDKDKILCLKPIAERFADIMPPGLWDASVSEKVNLLEKKLESMSDQSIQRLEGMLETCSLAGCVFALHENSRKKVMANIRVDTRIIMEIAVDKTYYYQPFNTEHENRLSEMITKVLSLVNEVW